MIKPHYIEEDEWQKKLCFSFQLKVRSVCAKLRTGMVEIGQIYVCIECGSWVELVKWSEVERSLKQKYYWHFDYNENDYFKNIRMSVM